VPVVSLPESNIPDFLGEYAADQYANVGTLFEADREVVNAAECDLIIVAGRSARLKPDLAQIAPTLDLTVDNGALMPTYTRNAEILGRVFGKEAEMRTVLADLQASIEDVRARTAASGTGLIVLTSGTEVTAYGPGSRFGIIHDVLGVPPAIPDVEAATHGEAISFELIAQTNPDQLFVVDRDAPTGDGAADDAQAAQRRGRARPHRRPRPARHQLRVLLLGPDGRDARRGRGPPGPARRDHGRAGAQGRLRHGHPGPGRRGQADRHLLHLSPRSKSTNGTFGQ
jgi:ABC-type Fe3+-hydroxamate transport system substrate-binding protein